MGGACTGNAEVAASEPDPTEPAEQATPAAEPKPTAIEVAGSDAVDRSQDVDAMEDFIGDAAELPEAELQERPAPVDDLLDLADSVAEQGCESDDLLRLTVADLTPLEDTYRDLGDIRPIDDLVILLLDIRHDCRAEGTSAKVSAVDAMAGAVRDSFIGGAAG